MRITVRSHILTELLRRGSEIIIDSGSTCRDGRPGAIYECTPSRAAYLSSGSRRTQLNCDGRRQVATSLGSVGTVIDARINPPAYLTRFSDLSKSLAGLSRSRERGQWAQTRTPQLRYVTSHGSRIRNARAKHTAYIPDPARASPNALSNGSLSLL